MKIIDLFAGCGGLALGFKEQNFETLAFLEWEKACIDTLRANFEEIKPTPLFLHKDIQDTQGCTEAEDGNLADLITDVGGLDGVIGGPPCQAYSMAGRVRDPLGMTQDYRNFLFEAYCRILAKFKPSFFVFENVTGLLSAKPNGFPITQEIEKAFDANGYYCGKINKDIVYDFADLGGPQRRKRVIIFGVRKDVQKCKQRVSTFHEKMRSLRCKNQTVQDAIGDLAPIFPLPEDERSARLSHANLSNDWMHHSRFHNDRDMKIFELLANDLKTPNPRYTSIEAIKQLYKDKVGKEAAVHKYYVLRENEASNLIPAHLHKDGLRHIHPDPTQSRTITAREAARLQTFPDDYLFKGSRSDVFKMIGNAVPPLFAEKVAKCVRAALKDE